MLAYVYISTLCTCWCTEEEGDEGSKVQSVDVFFFYLKTNGAHYCHTKLYVELPWGFQDSLTLYVCIPLILIIELAWRWSRMVKTYTANCYTFTKHSCAARETELLLMWTPVTKTLGDFTCVVHLVSHSWAHGMIQNILYNPSVVPVKSIRKPQNESAKYF